MATVTGLTAERMLEIEGESVVEGEIIGGNLILTKHNGDTVDAGPVIGPQGPTGPMGPSGVASIPGEVKLWPGGALPAQGPYGKWVWADGAVYLCRNISNRSGTYATHGVLHMVKVILVQLIFVFLICVVLLPWVWMLCLVVHALIA